MGKYNKGNPRKLPHNDLMAVKIPESVSIEDAEYIYKKGVGDGAGVVIGLLKKIGLFKNNKQEIIKRIRDKVDNTKIIHPAKYHIDNTGGEYVIMEGYTIIEKFLDLDEAQKELDILNGLVA